MMLNFLISANQILWNHIILWILLLGGVFFTFKLSFVQITHFKSALLSVFIKEHTNKKQLSSFGALCTSIAQRVGTGNLAGVATAISLGGEGAIFWMWVTAILGGATSFAECTLAQVFKIKNPDGSFTGGPAYYISLGLNQKTLAKIFSLLLVFSMGFVLNAVQSNTIALGLLEVIPLENYHFGLVLTFMCGLVILGGVQRISQVAQIIVPFMAISYILVVLVLLITNLPLIPGIFQKIFAQAFCLNAAGSGVLGGFISQAFRYGVARGLYSNEAGWGSAPNAAACAKVSHPVQQGLVQMLAVYIDTLLICTSTALMILLAPKADHSLVGIALTQNAAFLHFGFLGKIFICIAMCFFGFTTILGNTFYGEINVQFLSDKKIFIYLFRLLVLVTVFLGSLSQVMLVWEMADFMSALMTIINIICLVTLIKVVTKTFVHYKQGFASFSLKDIHLKVNSKKPLAFDE